MTVLPGHELRLEVPISSPIQIPDRFSGILSGTVQAEEVARPDALRRGARGQLPYLPGRSSAGQCLNRSVLEMLPAQYAQVRMPGLVSNKKIKECS